MAATLKKLNGIQTKTLKAAALGSGAVDREKNILRGYVVAEAGVFKSERGEFERRDLLQIVKLMKADPAGVKSRFTHPDFLSDGLGKYLGRAKNARLDGDKVRADLHFDKTAFATPFGDLAGYIMDLAESDPGALASSLVLDVRLEFRRKRDGTLESDENGNELPPLWRPVAISASDIVDVGDAVNSLLSGSAAAGGAEGDPDAGQEFAFLDGEAGDRDAVERAGLKALGAYLDGRFGPSVNHRPADLGKQIRELCLTRHRALVRIPPAYAGDPRRKASRAPTTQNPRRHIQRREAKTSRGPSIAEINARRIGRGVFSSMSRFLKGPWP